jgi:hypothetical protein
MGVDGFAEKSDGFPKVWLESGCCRPSRSRPWLPGPEHPKDLVSTQQRTSRSIHVQGLGNFLFYSCVRHTRYAGELN